MDVDSLTNQGHAGPLVSAIIYLGVGSVPFVIGLAWSLFSAMRLFRRAKEVEASHRPDASLAVGNALVRGRVEYAKNADYAVRVEITQEGTESEGSGGWSHAWTEVGRSMKTAAFFLVHASGRRIRVEPDTNVLLLDAMDGLVRVTPTTRKRVVQLAEGEEILAEGVLSNTIDPEAGATDSSGRGYREAASGLLLRPRPGKPMLLASEKLGARYSRRGRALLKVAALIVALGGVLHLFVIGPYLQLLWSGVPTTADVAAHTQWETENDGSTTQHWGLRLRARGGTEIYEFVAEVSQSDHGEVADGLRVPVLLVTSNPGNSVLGASATGNSANVLWLVFGIIAAAFFGRLVLRKSRGWYENPKIKDTGKGRLE